MQKYKFHKKIILGSIMAFLMFSGFSCKLQTAAVQEATKPNSLEFWGVYNNSGDFAEIISAYRSLHPNISINYRKFRYEEHKDKILEALAEDRGPDIISIHNTWVNEYRSKIEPMPASVKIPFQEVQGSLKKEVITTIKTVPSISLLQLKNDFVEAVYNDCVRNEDGKLKVLCLPFNIDNLALFYNKDILNSAGIPLPPATWEEFQEDVKRITKYGDDGEIIQSGAALGTAANISRSVDILSLLMLQQGTKMSDGNRVAFNAPVGNSRFLPGLQALQFYKAFADQTKEVYTWNNKMPDSLGAFIQGKTAFFFGYSYNAPTIKSRAPKLNFSITRAPQIAGETGENSINIANYWVQAVSEKSKNKEIAWNFIQFAATDPKLMSSYLAKIKSPTALRVLIDDQLNDMEINPFASQVLTAKSWYQGINSGAMEEIFSQMIDSIAEGADERIYQQALNTAAGKVQQTY
ncbi:MAG: extracellular solute-binding protein [bacterium]